ncbi:MAG: hypothetical protein LUO79_08940 [Methanomassiliicoccales archaeon]|nr:hypothetical protein [Methanomassiliicoccales archaeon]
MAKAEYGTHVGVIGPAKGREAMKYLVAGSFALTVILPVFLFLVYNSLDLIAIAVYGVPIALFVGVLFSSILLNNVFSRTIAPIEVYSNGLYTPLEKPLRLRRRVFVPSSDLKAVVLGRSFYQTQTPNAPGSNYSYLALIFRDGREEKVATRDTEILVQGALLISRTYGIELKQPAHKVLV